MNVSFLEQEHWLTCAEGVRRFGGVHRVMILQKLHLCEISGRSRP